MLLYSVDFKHKHMSQNESDYNFKIQQTAVTKHLHKQNKFDKEKRNLSFKSLLLLGIFRLD